ncbi:hypothetical protein [endosymbiont GvMRE of Glomus versiforme]|uniref:hypothetical protein n=1 Tax=endosymbiont GvMRE of Glomus versiforme TaxID=2039283 RepID=UPI000EC26278|nr:hypothetical protein [endosymbiont GvMRE of Glomus versiforme]RHZ35410.1 hypothetical protein GvMRE_IIg421 [endosymbiont GvMRE of Glomus versiforme]
MEKAKLVSFKKSKTDHNKVNIGKVFDNSKFRIELFDKNDDKVKYWNDLDINNDKVRITLEFDRKIPIEYEEDKKGTVEYSLKNNDSWEVGSNGKLITNLNEQEKFFKIIRAAHIDLFKERFKELFGKEKGEKIVGSDDIEYAIKTDYDENIVVAVWKEGDSKHVHNEFKGDQIEICVYFYFKERVTIWDLAQAIYFPSKTKKSLSKTKAIFLLAIFVAIIIIFWNKIWYRMRRRDKQKQKILEQINMF